jgi:hypothetical protein
MAEARRQVRPRKEMWQATTAHELTDADLEVLTTVFPRKIQWNAWSAAADSVEAIAALGREAKRLRVVEEQLRAELAAQRAGIVAELETHAADYESRGYTEEARWMATAARYVAADPEGENGDG